MRHPWWHLVVESVARWPGLPTLPRRYRPGKGDGGECCFYLRPRSPTMQQLLDHIAEIVGRDHLLTGETVRQRNADWFSHSPCEAATIVRPANTEQLSRVMALCHAAGQPVVTHGGLTGVVHGAVAAPNELAVSLERMTAIEAVDSVGGTLTAQAGVPLQRVQEAAAEIGMQFPVDLGARGSCTIGGNIATN